MHKPLFASRKTNFAKKMSDLKRKKNYKEKQSIPNTEN